MNILFLTMPQHQNECSYYSHYIKNYGGACVIFENQEDFFKTIREFTFKPDLLVLDYTHFNHLILNVYNYLLHTYHCTIPAVFFNDPNLNSEKRVEYWLEMLETMYKDRAEQLRSELYKKSLTLLSNAMEAYSKTDCQKEAVQTQLKTAFNAEIQEPALSKNSTPPVVNTEHASEQHSLQSEADLIYQSGISSQLSSSAYLIYDTLIKKAPEAASLQELINAIQKNEKTPSKNTVVCLISTIRAVLKQSPDKRYEIIKIHDGYKLLKR